MPTSRPTVSIVTSLYNKADYVERTARSILSQTFEDFEWVVVDDGSTDGSAERLPDDPRIRLVRQENAGMAAAVNRAAAEARGEFITFLDADDTFLPHKLATQVAALRANPGFDWVLAGFESHSDRGVRDCLPLGDAAPRKAVVPMEDAFTGLDLSGKRMDALLVRREYFAEVGGLVDEATPFDHFHFFHRLVLAHPRALVQQDVVSAYDLEVPGSLYKHRIKRLTTSRSLTGFFQDLAARYPHHRRALMQRAENCFCHYVRGLGIDGHRLRGLADLLFRYRGVRRKAFAAAFVRLLTPETMVAMAKVSLPVVRGFVAGGLAPAHAPVEAIRTRA